MDKREEIWTRGSKYRQDGVKMDKREEI